MRLSNWKCYAVIGFEQEELVYWDMAMNYCGIKIRYEVDQQLECRMYGVGDCWVNIIKSTAL